MRRLLTARIEPGLVLLAVSAGVLAGPYIGAIGGPIGLWAENIGHFRLLGLETAAVGALLARRSRVTLRAALALAVVHAWPVLSYSVPPARPAAAAAHDRPAVRLAYANLGWPDRRRPAAFEAWIRSVRPDLIALTEYDPPAEAALAGLLAEYPHRVAKVRTDRFGIALFSRLPLAETFAGPVDASGVPVALARIETPAVGVWVVHPLPPGSAETRRLRDDLMAGIADRSREAPGPLVVVGDLNATERLGSFRRLLDAGLRDSRDGYGWSPTWPASVAGLVFAVPIDHALVSVDVGVAGREVGPFFGSDHLPLLVDLVPAVTPSSRRVRGRS